MKKIQIKYWDVQEVVRDVFQVSLKEELNFNKMLGLNNDKYVLFFYKLTVGGIVPISPVKVKMYKSETDLLEGLFHRNGHVVQLSEDIVDFKKHPIEYPFVGVIKVKDNFLLKVKQERHKKNLFNHLDKAYESFHKFVI
ncbi:hypothetical protein [Viridibacillus arvi]|uniref:hypothetical protein n=1 Tax=Viridibacillus arvi TaxID=263475 RepID=UPI0034CE9B6B